MVIRSSLSGKERYIASVDLGSHTARFLLCRVVDSPEIIQPVVRKRFYTNLAKGFNQQETGTIDGKSIKRAENALREFSVISENYAPEVIIGAATGVFRRAQNSETLLDVIKEKTGIDIKIVTGEEEAAITIKGIIHSLALKERPDVFFDLGGSTTEIVFNNKNTSNIASLPLGAFVLNGLYLINDPPLAGEIENLREYIYRILSESISGRLKNNPTVIGSGGTITSLAALVNDFDKEEVNPEAINGIKLEFDQIMQVYNRIKELSFTERAKLKSIDEGRAEVIITGTIAVMTIMDFLRTNKLTVSYSDILEGLIISYLEGEKHE